MPAISSPPNSASTSSGAVASPRAAAFVIAARLRASAGIILPGASADTIIQGCRCESMNRQCRGRVANSHLAERDDVCAGLDLTDGDS